ALDVSGRLNGGGVPKRASGTIAVTVTEVNDAPSTATVGAQTTAEDTAINSIDVLTGASKGPANESGQTLSVVSSGPGAPTADHEIGRATGRERVKSATDG